MFLVHANEEALVFLRGIIIKEENCGRGNNFLPSWD